MAPTLLLALAVSAAGAAVGQPADAVCKGVKVGPRPLAVLYERSFLVAGWESRVPRFVLYANGEVIFSRCKKWEGCEYYQVVLSGQPLADWKLALAPTDTFLELEPHYSLVKNVSDLPEVEILLDDGSALRSVRVYGLSYPSATVGAFSVTGPTGGGDVLPPEFARYHALFHEFSARQAKRWKPQWIELDLTRADQYSMSADEERLAPFPWPKGWPSLDDEQSVRTGDYYATVFLPGKAERRLSSIYGWKAEEKAYGIALDGTRWIIEHWKAVFPGACSWEAVIAARGGVGS